MVLCQSSIVLNTCTDTKGPANPAGECGIEIIFEEKMLTNTCLQLKLQSQRPVVL